MRGRIDRRLSFKIALFSVLGAFLVMSSCAREETVVKFGARPFKEWYAVAYVNYRMAHPWEYIQKGNNWDVILALQEPKTLRELQESDLQVDRKQLRKLRFDGLVGKTGKDRWVSRMPVFGPFETEEIRALSSRLADTVYLEIKNDSRALVKEFEILGFADNGYSLFFSWLLDDLCWDRIAPIQEVERHIPWDGFCWALYDGPEHLVPGTNSNGYLSYTWTFSNARFELDTDFSGLLNKECLLHFGRFSDDLIEQFKGVGLADESGHVLIPVLDSRKDTTLFEIANRIAKHISSFLDSAVSECVCLSRLENVKKAKVILYHELMWDLLAQFVSDGLVTPPDILSSSEKTATPDDLRRVYFISR